MNLLLRLILIPLLMLVVLWFGFVVLVSVYFLIKDMVESWRKRVENSKRLG